MDQKNRRLQTAVSSSQIPVIKTLAEFDVGFQSSIRREQIDHLQEMGFLPRSENLIFPVPPAVGKTHQAISLAIATAENGRRLY